MTPWTPELPLIAILRGIGPDEVLDHVQALHEAGFDAIEIPTNSPDWQASVQRVSQAFGASLMTGAGTVLTSEHLAQLSAAGGRLMVTPNTNPTLITEAVSTYGFQVCAGFATASEAFAALQAGAQALKLFPSSVFGPDYVKALKAVLPAHVPLYAVGGINPGNLASYLDAGCAGAGLGSDLYRPGQQVAVTRERAQRFVQAWQAARAQAQ